MDRIIRSYIQRVTAFTNDHSASQAWKMDDISLTVCNKDPARGYIYKYFPNCCIYFRNNEPISVLLERLF